MYNTDSAGTAGTSHVIIPGLYLGGFIDAESDGQPNSTATGDDSNGVPNDEDGVTFPAFVPGQAGTVVVQATNATSQNATIFGFIDFSGDGDFGDSGETATATVTAGSSGPVNLVFNVPSSVNTSQAVGARFRLSTDSSLGPDGSASNGEVEDYLLRFADYGDLPDTGAGTGIANYNASLADNGARHLIDGTTFLGSRVDAETDGQPNTTASGDDANGTPDDEDGVIFLTPLAPGKRAKIEVVAGSAGYLSPFIDFNGDGTLDTVTIATGSPTGTAGNLIGDCRSPQEPTKSGSTCPPTPPGSNTAASAHCCVRPGRQQCHRPGCQR